VDGEAVEFVRVEDEVDLCNALVDDGDADDGDDSSAGFRDDAGGAVDQGGFAQAGEPGALGGGVLGDLDGSGEESRSEPGACPGVHAEHDVGVEQPNTLRTPSPVMACLELGTYVVVLVAAGGWRASQDLWVQRVATRSP